MSRPWNSRIPPHLHLGAVLRRTTGLLRTPIFWAISIWGNVGILAGAGLFHWLESGSNPAITSFIDSLTWAVGLVTTVGAPIHPITLPGKILNIVMMLAGAVFLWSYMAFFVGALVDEEIEQLQKPESESKKSS